jgi:purine-binding chemotaxis protein CheW
MVVLLVTAAEHLCAIALREVREVMRPLPTQPFPSPFPFIEGLAVVRGEPVPVVNLAHLLGSAPSSRPERLVTLKVGARTVGLAVGSVPGVRTLDDELVADMPPVLRGSGSPYVEQLSRVDRELVLVLGSARTVPDAFWAALDAAGGPA